MMSHQTRRRRDARRAALLLAAMLTAMLALMGCSPASRSETIPLLVQYQEDRYTVVLADQFYPCSGVRIRAGEGQAHDLVFLSEDGDTLLSEHLDGGESRLEIPEGATSLIISGEPGDSMQIEGILSTDGLDERERQEVRNPYQGKSFSVIGDSVSAYEGYIPEGELWHFPNGGVTVQNMWWYRLAKRLGMQVCRINACAGAGVTKLPWLYNEEAEPDPSLSFLGESPDLILIWLGGNDALSGLGDQIDGNYRSLLDDVGQRYPNAQIFLCTYYPVVPEIEQLNDEIRTLASEYHVQLLDVEQCGITSRNQDIYLMDGSHPNQKGHQLISGWMSEELLNR